MNARPVVAVVEDDTALREELALLLERAGYQVHACGSAAELAALMPDMPVPDAALLDIGMPGPNGISLARALRERLPQLGILMLTGRRGIPDRIASYDAGCDVYLFKPPEPEELLAALANVLRRHRPAGQSAWSLDVESGLLRSPTGAVLALTGRETRILVLLAQSLGDAVPGHVLREALGETQPLSRRALENLISRLRRRILSMDSESPSGGLRSDWQHGYQLQIPLTLLRHAGPPAPLARRA